RNPLHIAINFLNILGQDLRSLPPASPAMDDHVRQDITSIELALRRCRELTETWNIMLQPPGKTAEKVDLAGVVRQAAADTRLMPRARGARITMEGPDCAILFHAVLLKRALGNILLNAIQASPQGESVIHVAWSSDKGCVKLTVTDNGCGISAEQVEKIGQPFQSTKNRGEGTGLGLFMAMQTVRLFGGAIHINSEVGKGTTIAMHLLEFVPENLSLLPRA
ncbi:MAG: HAMP domain-containing sensor histidine kinase, partial [Kiritimatiellia bacterium]